MLSGFCAQSDNIANSLQLPRSLGIMSRFDTEIRQLCFAFRHSGLCICLRRERCCVLRVKFQEVGFQRSEFFNSLGPIIHQLTGLRRPLERQLSRASRTSDFGRASHRDRALGALAFKL